MTKDEVKEALMELFEERDRLDSETHAEHHDWIRTRIKTEEARQKMFVEVAKAALQWSVIGVLGWLLSHLGFFCKTRSMRG